MTISDFKVIPPCAAVPRDFDDEHALSLSDQIDITDAEQEEVNDADESRDDRRANVHRKCAGCPVLVDCLYRAVVEIDVSGFLACTTEADRQRMREVLGIRVQPTILPPIGASRVGSGPVSHESIVAARDEFPHDTCQQLAERLNCSTSTIKRHLRKAREAKLNQVNVSSIARDVPTIDDVLDAFDQLESSQVA